MTRTPDVVLLGGQLFLGTGAPPTPGAVAVAGDRIVAVGADADVAALAGGSTEVVDVGGALVLPGFQDAHVHPVYAGAQMIQCDLHGLVTEAETVAGVAAYAAAHPDLPWVLGGGWSMEAFPGGTPTRHMLDAAVPDRPAFLPNRDGHGAWVNTAALRRAGLTRDTADPVDGRIERDVDGEPSGTLHEGAASLVSRLVPGPTAADYDSAFDAAQEYLLSLGVTSWQDAIVGEVNGRPDNLAAYLRADDDGRLRARVVGALWWDRTRGLDQVPELVERRAATAGGRRFRATSVKIMQDGVAENFIAAMIDPYLDGCGCRTANAGISFVEPQALKAYVTALDAAAFQVHFHALGDRAVREALDAVEAAVAANGPGDRRHHLAHLQVVHPDDVPRFERLRAVATVQPLWACHEPQMDELTIPYLGEPRWRHQYPFGDLLRSGARLAGGSDWSVSTPDVMAAAHVAVNRVAPGQGPGAEPFLPEQRLTLAQVLAAYTSGSAHVNHQDDTTGTLAEGRLADLVVLDRNPFERPAAQIHATSVRRTYVGGELAYVSESDAAVG